MVHVSCDLCGRDLRSKDDPHYVVKIEVYAAQNPFEITEDDLDEDHMEAVSQILQSEDEDALSEGEENGGRRILRFDLCPTCREKFVKDPLNREAALHFDFSEN